MIHITQQQVIDLFDYRDGNLYWKAGGPGRRKNKLAGYYNKNGYRAICITHDGTKKKYYVHRLVFLYHHGYLPVFVDHVNRIVDDNRIENLRAADASKNGYNSISRGGTSRHKGISYHTKRKHWRARVIIGGVEHNLGWFKTEEEALKVYKEKVPLLQGEFFNPNSSLQSRE